MFNYKKIKRLESEIEYQRNRVSEAYEKQDDYYTRIEKKNAELNDTISNLVERLAKANPVYVGAYITYKSLFYKGTFEPTTKKKPEPKDETPLGDLRRYVEALERDTKIEADRRAEEAKQKEIRRLADEKVAEHVAKLHKAKKKK